MKYFSDKPGIYVKILIAIARGPPKDHSCHQICLNIAWWLQSRRFICESLQHMPSDGQSKHMAFVLGRQ